jgi:hypothetical protein
VFIKKNAQKWVQKEHAKSAALLLLQKRTRVWLLSGEKKPFTRKGTREARARRRER